MEKNKKSSIAVWSLIIAIVILFNLFINVSLGLVFKSPSYNDFCPNTNSYYKTEPAELTNAEMQAENEKYDKCQGEYDVARESYEKKVFSALIVIGVIVFLISLITSLNYTLATSLSLASVLNFLIASMRYWSSADEMLRFIILGIALAIFIWIGFKKFSD